MSKTEQELLLKVTDLCIQISASNKEVEMLRKENEFLKQLLLKHKNDEQTDN